MAHAAACRGPTAFGCTIPSSCTPSGRSAALTDEREGVVYDVALALANGRLIPQDLYDRAVKALGHDGITDVIVLMGYYTCVSLTMNFYSVPVSGGGTP